jgi:flagellar L-ring protein FlgH
MTVHILKSFLAAGAAACMLSGCSNFEKLADMGSSSPEMSPITRPGEQKPVDVPMPQQTGEVKATGSLWQPGARAFFRDPRASKVGDIITVDISIADAAKMSNDTKRTRANTETAGLTNFFGLENFLPSTMTASSLVNNSSDLSNEGVGSINRSETISLTLAALVTQVLTNGNLVIGGHQQVKVNGELRDLQLSGIIRTEDITSSNTVTLSQIAEARIAYGGKGTMSDVQEPRWGTKLLDILMPW